MSFSINLALEQQTAKEERNKLSYARTYQVDSTTTVEEAAVRTWVKGTGLVYAIGTTAHPVDGSAYLTSVDYQSDSEDKKTWKVVFNYETPTLSGSLPADPLAAPVEIDWGTVNETVDIFKDYQATPVSIVSSNGEAFDQQPQREKISLTCSYTKNETASFFHSTVLALFALELPCVNSGSFTIDGVSIPALYARLEIKSAAKQIQSGTTYYRVTYFLTFREGFTGHASDGWRERYLATGHYEWDGTDWVSIKDSDGNPVQKPWPLDSSGMKKTNATDEPDLVGPFSLYKEVSFTALGFA